ncbi:hypothetical protein RO3G_08105 [Rhizopus delemar RA 99-880]|uniref:Uncharacterized protein n=1 Tax=Rhizopus delemar (strain RA 99-880 / ATCC MYA-4621 / FGSC 9543 / NRRL 43880) TaxID=246409 RepID=I1C4M0_RHIO9|nr:hypothetical protein RO3G_08105 [Rhizopus delemar RA 99-880]|eukprot:EIE83400.1 hypothetical protein RO3G_08105 [Rhizopus delemar RA 99-880]
MSFVFVAKKCFRCSGNVPWSREHAAICPRDKPYHGPSKAIRSARLGTASSNGNKPNLTITPQARPQQASSKVSSGDSNLMDVDDEGYPVNYDFDRNVSGSVILATSDNVSKRFGTTKFPLSVIYGDNDKNLIHTSHSFEILPLSLDTEVPSDILILH